MVFLRIITVPFLGGFGPPPTVADLEFFHRRPVPNRKRVRMERNTSPRVGSTKKLKGDLRNVGIGIAVDGSTRFLFGTCDLKKGNRSGHTRVLIWDVMRYSATYH